MTTAIEASVNIQDDLAMSIGRVVGASPLPCMFRLPRLPRLELPSQNEADAHTTERDNLWLFTRVLPSIFHQISGGPKCSRPVVEWLARWVRLDALLVRS